MAENKIDSATDSMDMNLSKFQETVKHSRAWHAAVHRVTNSQTGLSNGTKIFRMLEVFHNEKGEKIPFLCVIWYPSLLESLLKPSALHLHRVWYEVPPAWSRDLPLLGAEPPTYFYLEQIIIWG